MDYSYDPENRLVQALDYQLTGKDSKNRIDRAVTSLEYDGGGRRLVQHYDPKNGGGGVDKRDEYVFDGLDPVAEYDMLNGQRTDYYRGEGGNIALMHQYKGGTQGQMYWYHYNNKKDVVGLTKQNGNSHHNYRYEPYGAVLPENGNFTDPHNHYTLTGKEFDENTGLVWFGARHYEPETGVWMGQDDFRGILDVPMSLHRYGYVHDNPVIYYDENGNAIPAIVVVAGALALQGAAEQTASTYLRDVVDNIFDADVHGFDNLKPRAGWKGYVGQTVGGMFVIPGVQETIGNAAERYYDKGEKTTLKQAGEDFCLGMGTLGFSHFISGKMAKKIIAEVGGRPAERFNTMLVGKLAQKDYMRSGIELLPKDLFNRFGNNVYQYAANNKDRIINSSKEQANRAWDYSVDQSKKASDWAVDQTSKAWNWSVEQGTKATDWTEQQADKAWGWSVDRGQELRKWLIPDVY